MRTNDTFTPGSIQLFSNWQGTFIYFIVLLISILLLNRQQKHLSIKNSQNNYPILSEEFVNDLNKSHLIEYKKLDE